MTMCDYCLKYTDCPAPDWHKKATINGDMYCPLFKSWLKRNISMAYVTPSFVSRKKSVTRRNWAEITIRQFPKDTTFLVFNKQARFGGEPIGVGVIVEAPYKENTFIMNDDEYINEGFEWLDDKYYGLSGTMPLKSVFERWRNKQEIMTVVRFGTLEVFPGMMDKYTTDEEIRRCVKALVRAIG